MRYALIDNSSLTGIQRLLGEIEVNNPSVLDNDILALENYLQAILFYDDIICIDDYKPTHRAKRINYFENVRFISKDLFDYDCLIDKSEKLTDNIILEISGGKITDNDFRSYLDRLKMTFQFTWDMSSSQFFLTQKMLLGNSIHDHDTFSKLHSVLFKQNNEQYEVLEVLKKREPILYDSDGNSIEIDPNTGKILKGGGDGMSAQFRALSSSLNWISQRTAFYVLAADVLKADLFIQPIRQEFLQNIIKRSYPSYELGVFNDLRNSINHQSEETLKRILENSNNFGLSMDIPLFSAHFAKHTMNSKKIIEAAMNEREKKPFFEARTKLRELYGMLEDGNRAKFVRDINLLTNELNETFTKVQREYGLGKNQGVSVSQIKFLLSCIPIVKNFELPDAFDIRIKQLEFMKHLSPKKGFNAVYRNLIQDLAEVDRLGEYKDVLLGNVRYSDKSTSYLIKTESPQYINASSYWKRPM